MYLLFFHPHNEFNNQITDFPEVNIILYLLAIFLIIKMIIENK